MSSMPFELMSHTHWSETFVLIIFREDVNFALCFSVNYSSVNVSFHTAVFERISYSPSEDCPGSFHSENLIENIQIYANPCSGQFSITYWSLK